MEIEESRATGWVAWVLLGGLLLVLLGSVHTIVGLATLFNPDLIAGDRADQLLSVSLTAIGWMHLVLGVICLVTGVGLIRGRNWARIVAVQLAVLAAVVNFLFVGVYPAWSMICIALACLVAYAVAVHGGEVADAYGS